MSSPAPTSPSMLTVTGFDLSINDLVNAARNASMQIHISPEALDRMANNRAFVDKVAARGDEVYGLTTGVGTRKNRSVSAAAHAEMVLFNKRMIREHSTGQGDTMPADVVRGAAILLLNTMAAGRSNIRPAVAVHVASRLCRGLQQPLAPIPMYGATGIGDVTPLAHLTMDLLGVGSSSTNDYTLDPEAGEALPLIAQSSVVTAQAAIAIFDTRVLLDQMIVLAVLDIEAFAANPSPYHEVVGSLRPYPGMQLVLSRFNMYLQGSQLQTAPQRHLQSPLSFRSAHSVLASACDTLDFCERQVAVECNAHQQNPYAFMEEDRMMPTANFDMQAIASALDFARISLAPCLTAQTERSMKLLQASESGLTDGLEPAGDSGGHGLSEISWPLQGMCAEARLLIAPVSAEIGSSTQAEGIEDRMTMAGLSGRRLSDMCSLGFRCCSISTVIACQAIDIRYHHQHTPPIAPINSMPSPISTLTSTPFSASDKLDSVVQSMPDPDKVYTMLLNYLRESQGLPEATTVAATVGTMTANASNSSYNIRMSTNLSAVHARVRTIVPFLSPGDPPPASLESLVEALRRGVLSAV